MTRTTDLPHATIRYRTVLTDRGSSVCEVIVDGTPIARLACTGVELLSNHREGIPHIKLGFLGENVDLQTHAPQRSA